MGFHLVSMVSISIEQKQLFAILNNRFGNIIRIIFHFVCLAWEKLLRLVDDSELNANLLPISFKANKQGVMNTFVLDLASPPRAIGNI